VVKRNQNHWIAGEKTRRWFFKDLKETYGLTGEEAKKLLGIKSFYEWLGTIEELHKKLEEEGPGW